VVSAADDAIKGAALREFLGWYASARSEEELRAVIGSLPEPARSRFDPALPALGVLASTWYPTEAIHALLDRMTAGMSRAEREAFAVEGASVVMRNTLRGLYKALFRVIATPDRYPRMASRVWSQYYRSGDFKVENQGSGSSRSYIRAWTSHHPVLCDMNGAAAQVIYETMGCQGVAVTRVSCVDGGGPECSFVVRWTGGPGA
jgi:hypothetical protein